MRTLTKYCNDSSWGYNGFTDNKAVLDLEDDAANANLGGNTLVGSWRMPTNDDWNELRTKCTWEWKTPEDEGYTCYGYLVTGLNGNSIFLPAAGNREGTQVVTLTVAPHGGYWSSSRHIQCTAYRLMFYSGSVYSNNDIRTKGYSIRPVKD